MKEHGTRKSPRGASSSRCSAATSYLCGQAHGEVVAEKLSIHAQLKPKSMTDAFKAAADAWRAALHPLLHPADHPSGRASAPRRDDIGADELEPLVRQLLDGVAWPPD